MRKATRIGEKKHVDFGRFHEKKFTFLKDWRIVRYYIKRKYGLSQSDLDVLLFLYDEHRFTKETFFEFSNTMQWSPRRFDIMQEKGFIVVWREKNEVANRKALYELATTSKLLVAGVYKKLLGEEKISENTSVNPIMRGDTYTDRVYRMAIRKMNKR